MRKLLWFTVGFTIACAFGSYLSLGKWMLVLCAVCLVCMTVLLLIKRTVGKIAAVVLLGCVVGFGWNWCYQHFYLQSAMNLDEQKQCMMITATDYSYETDYGIAVDGKLRYAGKTYRVKLYIYDHVMLEPGDQITGELSFRYTAQGAVKDPTYHQGKGILLLAYCGDEYEIQGPVEDKAVYFAVKLRKQITGMMDRLFHQDVVGFAKALLLGDNSGMSYELDTAFADSGISHVIAVSGLHVSILYSILYMLFLRQRHLTALFGIPILLLFTAVAGFTPSIVRACIMQIMIILAMLIQKEYDPPTALAFSVLVILAVNPLAITSVGFQLSVACMIGIFAFSGKIQSYLFSRKWASASRGRGMIARTLRIVISSVSISLSVWVVTTPLCAIHFGVISAVSIATNLLTVWMVNYIFYGIILTCVLAAVWMPMGVFAAHLIALPMRLVQLIATALSKIPFAAVYTCDSYVVMWLVLCYVLLFLFVLLRYKRPVLLIICMLTGFLMSCTASLITERMVDSRITILDVGEGQCILLKHNDGYYMVDCGGSNNYDTADIATEYLLSRGVRRLDGVILTHYDPDHAGAVLMLLTRVEADKLYLPELDPDNELRRQLTEKYTDKIIWVDDRQQIPTSDITLFCGEDKTSDKESGICVLFQPDNYDILILGERNRNGEIALMEQTDLPPLELLISGSHGAANTTGFELLIKTQPQAVVFSVGENRYGHPDPAVLDRLDDFGCRVYRTDTDGTIEFRR